MPGPITRRGVCLRSSSVIRRPIACTALQPKIRSAAGFHFSMRSSGESEMMASPADEMVCSSRCFVSAISP